MPRVSAIHLDHSSEMRDYFLKVEGLLESAHDIPTPAARALIERYFSIDVSPLERVLTMHSDAASVADDLAQAHRLDRQEVWERAG